jgi:hypothetical protein
MNGRPFALGPAHGTAQQRVDHMVDETRAALFRDRVLTPTTILATVVEHLARQQALQFTGANQPRSNWRWSGRR